MNVPIHGLAPLRGPLVILLNFLPIMAVASMTSSMPVMMDHFAGRANAGFLVPLIVTAPALMIALLGTFAGQLVDRIGRRGPLIWACLLYGAAGSSTLLFDSLAAIIAARLVLGVAEAALITISTTLIADYWDEKGRRFWLTAQGVSGPFLTSGLIVISGYLAAQVWNSVFALYLVGFPLALACWAILPEPKVNVREGGEIGKVGKASSSLFRTILPLLLITLATAILFYVWIVQGGLAFRELGVTSPARQGEIFALAHLAVIAGALLYAASGRFFDPRGQAALMLVLMGAGLLLIGLASSERSLIIGLLVQQTAAGMNVLVLISWAHRILPEHLRGRGMGMWAAVFFSGQFISPVLFGGVGAFMPEVLARFSLFGAIGLVLAILLGLWSIQTRHNSELKL